MIVERREREHTKCCGCCLAPRGVRRLHELGLGSALHVASRAGQSNATRRWRLRAEDGTILLGADLGDEPGACVARHRFDAALLDAAVEAGAEVWRGAALRIEEDGTVAIRRRNAHADERLRAAIVVGADGIGSGVARAAGLVARRARGLAGVHRRIGFSWRIDGAEAAALELDESTIEIHLVSGGYLGLVRIDGSVHAAALTEPTSPRLLLDAWSSRSSRLAALAGTDPHRASDFAATGPLPWRPRAITGAIGNTAVVLTGDAAGYEQPFTGEGMTWAIESAGILAEAIVRHGRWSDRASRDYAQAHQEAFALRRWRLRAIAAAGAGWLRRPTWALAIRMAGRMPVVPGAIVRSVVAA